MSDSKVPADPQSWDRYAYAFDNPVKYNDPSGHCPWCLVGGAVGAIVGAIAYTATHPGDSFNTGEMLMSAGGGALIGSGAVIFAPVAAAAAGDLLVGAGVAVGSAGLFGAGMSAYGASAALDGIIYGESAVANAPILAPPTTQASAPDFIGTENGELIPVPSGATGPTPTHNGAGFQYTGGSGGNGLDPRVTDVRIMDPTLPKPPSPGYPNGYAVYSNASGQPVNPYTGRTVAPSDPWRHINLK